MVLQDESGSLRRGSKLTHTVRVPRWVVLVAATVVVLGLMAATFFVGRSWNSAPESSSPSITDIQRLGELTVLKVKVGDVLEDANQDFKGIWLIRGDALVAVDLQLAELLKADANTKNMVVRLPQPKVIQPRVNFNETKTYDVQKKSWWPFVGGREKFTDNAMSKAQGVVYNTSNGADVMAQARDQTERVLKNMYRLVGWNVDVVWQGASESSKTAQ